MGDNVVSTVDHLAGDPAPFGRSTGSSDNVVGNEKIILAMANYLDLTEQDSIANPPAGTVRLWFDGSNINVTTSAGVTSSFFQPSAGGLTYSDGSLLTDTAGDIYYSTAFGSLKFVDASTANINYTSGLILYNATNGTLNDPAGNALADENTIYYPGGNDLTLADTDSLRDPNGATLSDGLAIYYPGDENNVLVDSGTIYYPSEATLATSTQINFPGGSTMGDSSKNLYIGISGPLTGNGSGSPISS